MSKILSPDNAFFTTLNKIIDLIWLSILWSILCMPNIWMFMLLSTGELEGMGFIFFIEMMVKSPLIGPAMTALYYTIVKVIRRERGYATKQFFHAFKANFKTGALISVTYAVFAYLMYVDFQYAMYMINDGSFFGKIMYVAFFCVCAFAVFCLMWIFPILSRFKVTYKQAFRNAFLISIKHFVRSLLMIVFIGAYAILFANYLQLQFYLLIPAVIPACSVLVRSFIIEPVMKKYTTEAEGTEEETGEDRWYLE